MAKEQQRKESYIMEQSVQIISNIGAEEINKLYYRIEGSKTGKPDFELF